MDKLIQVHHVLVVIVKNFVVDGMRVQGGGSSSNNNNPTIGSSSSSSNEAVDGSSNTGTDWIGICTTLQPALYSSCHTLVNSGTLTAEGQRALGCIRNGAMLASGAGLLGVPLPFISRGLSLLPAPTGCGGIVKMDEINNVVSSIGGIGVLSHLLP